VLTRCSGPSVEWVIFHEPDTIDFLAVEGPLHFLNDRFVLEDAAGCTRFRYVSTFGLKGWIVGWLVGRFRVKPFLILFMIEHTRALIATIEERAKRSPVFSDPTACPFTECESQARPAAAPIDGRGHGRPLPSSGVRQGSVK
jgi:hypothetical protein